MPKRPKHILLNAMHATTGGGLTYLRGVIPELARDERFTWTLLAPESALAGWEVPENVVVKIAPELGFWKGHVWEQFKLPLLCHGWGIKAVLCNANYTPLLAPNAMPIIHTTARAAGQAQDLRMKIYWKVLKVLTTMSIWNAPVAFSVAQHVIGDYVGPWMAKKVRVAPPAVTVNLPEAVERDPNLVVTIGDFYAQKDYPLLVRAFKLLRDKRPETRLMIIGRPVDAKVRDEVLALIRELGLADAVTLTGGMAHERLLLTLARASMLVSASQAETVQIPLLEAMATGVPVVTCALPHAEEFVGKAGILVPVDKDITANFALAMRHVLDDKVLSDDLRASGLERMKGYTWAATAKVLADGIAGEKR